MDSLTNFLENNAIYVVLLIVMIVWIGIFLYMLALDKRIKKVEKEMNGEKNEK